MTRFSQRTVPYRVMRIDRVVNKLETERPVAWSEIEEAMVVPNESAWVPPGGRVLEPSSARAQLASRDNGARP